MKECYHSRIEFVKFRMSETLIIATLCGLVIICVVLKGIHIARINCLVRILKSILTLFSRKGNTEPYTHAIIIFNYHPAQPSRSKLRY